MSPSLTLSQLAEHKAEPRLALYGNQTVSRKGHAEKIEEIMNILRDIGKSIETIFPGVGTPSPLTSRDGPSLRLMLYQVCLSLYDSNVIRLITTGDSFMSAANSATRSSVKGITVERFCQNKSSRPHSPCGRLSRRREQKRSNTRRSPAFKLARYVHHCHG